MDGKETEFENFKIHLKNLLKQKDELEEEMKVLIEELKKIGGEVGVPLIDRDGYPVSDLDIHNIRIKRNRYACLQTDYSNLMKEIEGGLVKLHSMKKVDIPSPTHTKKNLFVKKQNPPFLLVDMIFPNSPVSGTGLKENDEITKFGELTKADIEKHGLKVLSSFVQNMKNKKINVEVLRNRETLEISFVPKEWQGRGLLGFHVKPIK